MWNWWRRKAPQPIDADVSVGDIVTCGPIVGKVQQLVANDGGTVDAIIRVRLENGETRQMELPADGRYEIALCVVRPEEAQARGWLFRRMRVAS